MMINSEGVKIVIQITSNSNKGSSTTSGFDNSRKRKVPPVGNGSKKPCVKIEPDDGLKIIKLTDPENDEPTPDPALLKTDTNCVRGLLSSIQYRVTLLSE